MKRAPRIAVIACAGFALTGLYGYVISRATQPTHNEIVTEIGLKAVAQATCVGNLPFWDWHLVAGVVLLNQANAADVSSEEIAVAMDTVKKVIQEHGAEGVLKFCDAMQPRLEQLNKDVVALRERVR